MSAERARMDGRVCVSTGATAGIGKETALALARLGATVMIVATDLLRQLPRWLYVLISPFLLTLEQGAATTVFLASSPAVDGVNGGYYQKCRAARSSQRSYDAETRNRLWDVSEAMVNAHLAVPPVPTN